MNSAPAGDWSTRLLELQLSRVFGRIHAVGRVVFGRAAGSDRTGSWDALCDSKRSSSSIGAKGCHGGRGDRWIQRSYSLRGEFRYDVGISMKPCRVGISMLPCLDAGRIESFFLDKATESQREYTSARKAAWGRVER